MALKWEDNSFNFGINPKKKYERSVYWCKKDDIWVNVEIPSNKK